MNTQPFIEAIEQSGLVPPDYLKVTDKPHRWAGNPNKPREKNSWYIFDGESITWGDWALGSGNNGKISSYRAGNDLNQTPEQVQATLEARRQRQALRDRERAQQAATGAAQAQATYDAATPCNHHPYLIRKGIAAPSGLKLARDSRLIVPVYGRDGEIISLQFIAGDGTKRFLTDASVKGGWFAIGRVDDPTVVAVAEGMATAASIHAATAWPCYVGFSCSGLRAAAEVAQAHYPSAQIIICGDKGNGEAHAQAAATAVSAICVIPQLISGTDFNDLAATQGLEVVRQQLELAINIANLPEVVQRLLRAQAITPHETYCERYCRELNLHEQTFVALKAEKGTGKTQAIAKAITSLAGSRTTLITHRRQLGQALCERMKLPFGEANSSTASLGMGLCIDSLVKLETDDWGDTVVIDEVEQVITHLLTANTEIRKHRAKAIQVLENLLKQAKQIVIADADLSPLSIEFIEALSGRKLHIIENQYHHPEAYPVYHYENHEAWLSKLVGAARDDQKLLLLTDSQKVKSKWSSQTLEAGLLEIIPELRILRIDSETVNTPNHVAYNVASRINEIIDSYDVVIASPSIETGVSIDVRNYFTSVWGVFAGVLPENSVRQFLARLRDNVPRHIHLPKMGKCTQGDGEDTPEKLIRSHQTKVKQLRTLYMDEFTSVSTTGKVHVDTTALNAWIDIHTRINIPAKEYRQTILSRLGHAGHPVHMIDAAGSDQSALETLEEARDILRVSQQHQITNAQEINEAEYRRLDRKQSHTQEERAQLMKAKLSQRYGVPVCPELITLDEKGFYSRLRLLYFLTDRSALTVSDRRRLERARNKPTFQPDLVGALHGHKIALLDALGVTPLLADPNREYRASDTDVQSLYVSAMARCMEIKETLGISLNSKFTAIEVLSSFFEALAVKIRVVKREGPRSNRQRVYARKDCPLHDQILQAWSARPQIQASHELFGVHQK